MKEKIKKIYNEVFGVKEENNKYFIIIVTIIYAIIMITVCCFHEAWEDESQAWLIARDLSLKEISEQMKYEGHSCLWHYILVPFAKTGLPFDAIKVLGIIPAIITVILILKKAPFSRFSKILIIFSSTFLYYMPAIIRPYSLLPLLVVLLCILYKDRREKPILYGILLALISNLHIILIGFTGMLILTFYVEELIINRKKLSKEQKIKYIIGGLIGIFGILIIVYYAIKGTMYSTVKVPNKISFDLIENNLFIYLYETVLFIFGAKYAIHRTIISSISIAIIIIQSVLNTRKQGLIFFGSMLWICFVQTVIWNMQINQRAAIPLILLIFYAWCYRYDKMYSNDKITSKLVIGLICIVCILSLNETIQLIKDEIERPYVDSRQIAKMIEENIEEGAVIATNNYECTSPIIAYLSGKDYKFFDIKYNQYLTYITWSDKERVDIDLKKVYEYIGAEDKPKYLLYGLYAGDSIALQEIYNLNDYEYKCIYASGDCIFRGYELFELVEKEQ